ncbi:MAG: tetratricopeptide repeat protein [Caulobacteraceae bacterium]
MLVFAARSPASDILARRAAAALTLGEPHLAASLSQRALGLDPLNLAALNELGLSRSKLGQTTGAEAAMTLAQRLSRRDPAAETWLFQHRLMEGDAEDAFIEADIALRTNPDPALRAALFRIFDLSLPVPDARAALERRLELQPPWRSDYLASAPGRLSDPTLALPLLKSLESGAAPPSAPERAAFIAALLARQKWRAALQDEAILTARPAMAQAWLRDGGFTGLGDVGPFDWDLQPAPGAEASFDRDAEGGGELRIGYNGFSHPSLPRQLLVLSPGAWRLSWRETGEGGGNGAGLSWVLQCAGTGIGLGRSEDGGVGAQQRRELTFDVPPSACDAQWIGLVPDPADREIPLVRRYSDMRLSPVGRTSPTMTPQQKAKRPASASVRRG